MQTKGSPSTQPSPIGFSAGAARPEGLAAELRSGSGPEQREIVAALVDRVVIATASVRIVLKCEPGAVFWNLGLFINAVIKFLIIAFAIFLLVKAMNRLIRKEVEEPEAAPQPALEVELLREIRDLLARGPIPGA